MSVSWHQGFQTSHWYNWKFVYKMRHFALLLVASVGFCQQATFTNGQAARLVIGQPTFTEQSPGYEDSGKPDEPNDSQAVPSQWLLGGVGGIAYSNNRLFVADSNRVGSTPDNNRIVIYNDVSSLVPRAQDGFQQGDRCNACRQGPASSVLGQKEFNTNARGLENGGLRQPTAVATDGNRVAVADTNNNRVLIWNSTPTTNGQPPDVVIGQVDSNSIRPVFTDQISLRGPQGVWFQNGKLFIADTQNHRVLIYNAVPTTNNAPADIVLGQPDFNTKQEPSAEQILSGQFNAQQNTMLNPVSVTSDGTRLFVSDLGHNRVLIWNSIPAQNQQQADIVLGQPDFTSALANNSSKVCESNGKDADENPTYPGRCAKSLSFPRFALSDGTKLYVADAGNDRILIWNTIPTQSTQAADVVLGQITMEVNNTSDSAAFDQVSASDVIRTPSSLAVDSTNLYVSDTYNRRVLVFTPADPKIPYTGVRNAASLTTYALGSVTFDGEIKADDEITIKIGDGDSTNGEDVEYKYKIVENDTFDNIVNNFVTQINGANNGTGDPNVFVSPNLALQQIILSAKLGGVAGNNVTYSTTLSESAVVTATTGGATLAGGADATKLAPGTVVTIVGERLSELTDRVPEGTESLPTTLANVEVFFDGIRSPLTMVSPTQINAQLPFEIGNATSVSAMTRLTKQDGTVEINTAVGVPVISANPGIFTIDDANNTTEPRRGIVLHGSSFATATISIDGSETVGDTGTIIIAGDRRYSYTLVEGDTLLVLRNKLVEAISASDPQVTAYTADQFNRIRIQARIAGPAGNGIAIGFEVDGKDDDEATVIISPLNTQLCCANVAGTQVTEANPAVPGETLIIYTTGLGEIGPEEAKNARKTGDAYNGPEYNYPLVLVDDALAGGKTANVMFSRLMRGTVGVYEIVLELNSDIPTNPDTQLYIAQGFQRSNVVRFAVRNPAETP